MFFRRGRCICYKRDIKKLKELKKDTSPEAQNTYRIFSKVCDLTQDEKTLRTDIKNKTLKLETKTKETIENLSDEQVLKLLEEKWISPLKSELDKLPDVIVDTLVAGIQALQSKYATTFMDIENEIHETEKQLVKMIDELDGSEYDLKGLGELKALLMGD